MLEEGIGMNDRPTKTIRRSRNEEARLDRKMKALLGKGPEDYSASEWQGMREQMRLCLLYPGCYVAHRDHHTGEGPSWRLVRREVLFVCRTLIGLNRRLATLPDPDDPDVRIVYVDPPDAVLRIGC
jgi:hypothetical protein